jgi:dipeptidyl aminopeptidase/acylaminoacyl peptidase
VGRWMIALRVGAWALLGGAGLSVTAQPSPPPAADFVRGPAISNVAISPSGQRLALVTTSQQGRRVAAVITLAPLSPMKVVAAFSQAHVDWVRWVNDDRIVLGASQDAAVLDREDMAGTFAVNHDGEGLRQLIAHRHAFDSTGTNIRLRMLTYGWYVSGVLDDGSADVIVSRRRWDGQGDRIDDRPARLNTITGEVKRLDFGMPAGAARVVYDARNEPRVLSIWRDGRHQIHWREPGRDDWKLIEEFAWFADQGFVPRYLDSEHELVVEGHNGRDAAALYRYDLRTRKLDPEPLLAIGGFDIHAVLEHDSRTRRVVGVHTRSERPLSIWFDARLAAIQKAVDAALPPGRSNRLYCGRCESSRFFFVHSSSDRQPGEHFLFDEQERSLQRIGASRPWIDEARQGRRSFHRVAARDGLSLPVYVTHPAGSRPDDPLPAVVLPHGGPFVRGGDLGWSPEAQFLASRGWRVIEPEFRGSDGYGFAHYKAGFGQWGLAMQDDLADVVQWAAKERLIDADRVCLYGGGYGGYAALMGLARHPQLYRCAASFAGVTDLDLLYTSGQSDLSRQSKRYSLPTLLGERGSAALRDNSPIHRVADIKAPVLLAHGSLDRRVPIEHADAFARAAQRAGIKLERVTYPQQAHGWTGDADHADFLQRLERFLARSLDAPR